MKRRFLEMTFRDLPLCIAIAMLTFACVTTGCAKTIVTARQTYSENEQLPKPDRIVVYDFAATPEDLPADDPIIGLYEKPARPQTENEISLGRKLGAEIAEELVKEILNLGMPAEHSSAGPTPAIGDLVIKGAVVSIDKGDRLKRILIGFGAGTGELKTLVEIYQITTEGHRPLVSEEITTRGGKFPGMLFTVAVAVAAGPVGLSVAPAAVPAGTFGEATATSGSVNTAKELGPESLKAAAKRTAKEITKALTQILVRHGWFRP